MHTGMNSLDIQWQKLDVLARHRGTSSQTLKTCECQPMPSRSLNWTTVRAMIRKFMEK